MKLLSEINEAAEALIEKTANVQQFMDVTGLGIEPVNEAVTQFLTNFATKIEKGDFKPKSDKKNDAWQKERENVINIFAAIHTLTDLPIAMKQTSVGSILNDFYGKNGKEQHKLAKNKLAEIGRSASPTIRARASKAVDDPTRIREYANRLQVDIEPVMNKLLSQERNTNTAREQKDRAKEKQFTAAPTA